MSDSEPKAKIMVVDDTPANLKLLEDMLEARDYQVRAFSRGRPALAAAASQPPDLILLDVNMPEMNGYEVCKQLKADAKLKDIPVLFISALNETTDKVKAFSCGGVDYVTKPFQFEEVQARVQTHLELQRQKRELQENCTRLHELETLHDNLTHMIIHDLRAPLSIAIGYLDLLKQTAASKLDRNEIGHLDTTFTNIWRLNDMIGSLLDINRLETNNMPLNRCACDMAVLAKSVVDSFESLAGKRSASFESPSKPMLASCDEEVTRRVIGNLLQNALKFTPKDGSIHIAMSRKDAMVRLKMSDNGPGIPAEYHGKIFEKFGQVAKTVRQYSTGLGLTFCKLAVEAQGGQIGVESEVGKGSTFWFTLPAA